MKLAIVCPKCSFRLTEDLEHALNVGICPKCGTEIEALRGENKDNIGVVHMFIASVRELNLPWTPEQILALINKFFREKSKLSLPLFEIDAPLSQKLKEMASDLTPKVSAPEKEQEAEEPEEPAAPKTNKKPKKIPKMKELNASSTPGIKVPENEIKKMMHELNKEPLVAPPSAEDYSEDGFSFGVPGDATAESTDGRSVNLQSIRAKIQKYRDQVEE